MEECLFCGAVCPPLSSKPEGPSTPDLNVENLTTDYPCMTLALHILDLPIDMCDRLLKSTGGNSEVWFRRCQACLPLAEEGVRLFHEIDRLRRQFEDIKSKLKGKIKTFRESAAGRLSEKNLKTSINGTLLELRALVPIDEGILT